MHRFKLVGILARVVVVALVGAGFASAQVTLDPAWPENPRTFGGEDSGFAKSVQQTTDGGYIVAGAVRGDVYVIKLDSQGDLDTAWDANPKTFGGDDVDAAYSVQQTSDGGYIVAGQTGSFGAGEEDAYLIKLDVDGNLDPAWDPNPKTYGGPAPDKAYSVQQASDGGYIIVGSTWSFGNTLDVYVIKLDSEGNLDPTWDPNPKAFREGDFNQAHSVQQTVDGGYIVLGTTEFPGPVRGDVDIYLIKLDSLGNLDPTWDSNPRTFGGEMSDLGGSVQQTTDGGYVVAGGTLSLDAKGSNWDAYIIKLDRNGALDPAWSQNPKTFGEDGWEESAHSVHQTSEGGYIVAGRSWSWHIAEVDVYLMKLDSLGNLDPTWDPNPRIFGGEYNEVYSVQQIADGGYVVAGFSDVKFEEGYDVWLLKLAPARHFLRGDCNADGKATGDVSDAVSLLEHNFAGGDRPSCMAACDANGDGSTGGVTDAVYLLLHSFRGGEPPPSPFPDCGAGQLWTDGPLTCEIEPECP